MNYTELVAAIQDYTQNEETSFVSNIPTFVRQSEERLNRSIMVPELRKNVTALTSNGSVYLARPADFLSVFSLAVIDSSGDYSFLIDKDVNFIREAYPSASTSALPKYYAQFDGDLMGSRVTLFLVQHLTTPTQLSYITTTIRLQSLPQGHLGTATTPNLLYFMVL